MKRVTARYAEWQRTEPGLIMKHSRSADEQQLSDSFTFMLCSFACSSQLALIRRLEIKGFIADYPRRLDFHCSATIFVVIFNTHGQSLALWSWTRSKTGVSVRWHHHIWTAASMSRTVVATTRATAWQHVGACCGDVSVERGRPAGPPRDLSPHWNQI